MIAPTRHWCVQIDVTNRCTMPCVGPDGKHSGCSNCTRLNAHAAEPYFMDLETFAQACESLKGFRQNSLPDYHKRPKFVGMMGGDPQCHPQFPELCRIMVEHMDPRQCAVWFGPVQDRYRELIESTWGPLDQKDQRHWNMPHGYIHSNAHTEADACVHHPLLVAIRDLIDDEAEMWSRIQACPYQEKWSSCVTPRGAFFCEVAAAFDTVIGAGLGEESLGLPVGTAEQPWWQRPLSDFAMQIKRWCPHCGGAIPLPARRDKDCLDDVSESNLEVLTQIGSPRIAAGRFRLFDRAEFDADAGGKHWDPVRYARGRYGKGGDKNEFVRGSREPGAGSRGEEAAEGGAA